MSDLLLRLRKAAAFIEKRPKLAASGALQPVTAALEKALTKYLGKADDFELEQKPEYAEVAALIEGEAKSMVTTAFMRKFAHKEAIQDFLPKKADKGTRTKFLKMVAKADKLVSLQKELDPAKHYRELFDAVVKLRIPEIENELVAMSPKDLTGLVDANGLTAARTPKGQVRKTKAGLASILSQINDMKLAEHF